MKRDRKGEKTPRGIEIHSVTQTLVYFPEYSRSLTMRIVGCFVELRRNVQTLIRPLGGVSTCSIRCDSIYRPPSWLDMISHPESGLVCNMLESRSSSMF